MCADLDPSGALFWEGRGGGGGFLLYSCLIGLQRLRVGSGGGGGWSSFLSLRTALR